MTKPTEVIDSKDFTIRQLQKQIAEREAEILRLEKRLMTAEYFATTTSASLRIIIDRHILTIRDALKGELQMPVLREISNTEGI